MDGNLGIFQYCHCSRCRKFTGSAHAANILVKPEQFSWLSGSQQIGTFMPEETKHFTTAFCKNVALHCRGWRSPAKRW
ncbi:GFA family protein [Aliamphritea spongicola]|nr:GFA family protein [Aliamphritea spongicola]